VPFYRLAGLEASLGIPLPPATQWEIVKETADVIQPAFDALIRQAAQGEVLYNDDTAVIPRFPEKCRYVLENLGKVYGYDAQAEEQGLSPEERLRFHQEYRGPIMDELHAWLRAQCEKKEVEPNSGLGTAITYALRHCGRLGLFLRQPGAPLDSNIVGRALKRAILHRKNSLFYKTENGAEVGDLFMSLTHTCELNDTNTFHYLTELQKHAADLAKNPAQWMPWIYRQTLPPAGTTKPTA